MAVLQNGKAADSYALSFILQVSVDTVFLLINKLVNSTKRLPEATVLRYS